MNQKYNTLQWAKHQRRWFGKWHTYLGIIAGIVVSFIAATGSILVFQDEIDHALNPRLYHTLKDKPILGFSEVLAIVRKEYPQKTVTSISVAESGSLYSAYKVMLSSKEKQKEVTEIFINPYNGTVCGKRIYQSSFMKIVTELHVNLLLSLPGRILVGLSTLVLLILTISGMRLWIPSKWKQLRSVLLVKFSSGWKRQNYDWHNTVGFYTAPFVFVLSLTGFCMNLGILGAPALMKVGGEDLSVIKKLIGTKSTYSKNAVQLPLDDILAAVKKEMPDAEVKSLLLPGDTTGTFALQVYVPNKIGKSKINALLIDQYSGEILFNSTKDFQQIGKAYLGWIQPLHYGSFGGLPTKILAFIGGLAPLILTITGFVIWWPRYKKQKRRKPKPAPSIVLERAVPSQPKRPTSSYRQVMRENFKKGTGYALWILLVSFVMGAIYGAPSGVIVEPAFLTVYLVTSIVVLNFVVALVVSVLSLLAKVVVMIRTDLKIYGSVRYFALSVSFLLVFVTAYFILYRLGLTTF